MDVTDGPCYGCGMPAPDCELRRRSTGDRCCGLCDHPAVAR